MRKAGVGRGRGGRLTIRLIKLGPLKFKLSALLRAGSKPCCSSLSSPCALEGYCQMALGPQSCLAQRVRQPPTVVSRWRPVCSCRLTDQLRRLETQGS